MVFVCYQLSYFQPNIRNNETKSCYKISDYSSKCTDFVRFSFNLVSAWYSPSHLACKNYEDKELRKFGLLGQRWFMVRMKIGEKQRLERKFEGKIPHTRKIGRKSSVLSQTPALPRSSCRIELDTSALRHFDLLWCDLQPHYCIHRLHLSLSTRQLFIIPPFMPRSVPMISMFCFWWLLAAEYTKKYGIVTSPIVDANNVSVRARNTFHSEQTKKTRTNNVFWAVGRLVLPG